MGEKSPISPQKETGQTELYHRTSESKGPVEESVVKKICPFCNAQKIDSDPVSTGTDTVGIWKYDRLLSVFYPFLLIGRWRGGSMSRFPYSFFQRIGCRDAGRILRYGQC